MVCRVLNMHIDKTRNVCLVFDEMNISRTNVGLKSRITGFFLIVIREQCALYTLSCERENLCNSNISLNITIALCWTFDENRIAFEMIRPNHYYLFRRNTSYRVFLNSTRKNKY